jgi:hypothetical protein
LTLHRRERPYRWFRARQPGSAEPQLGIAEPPSTHGMPS